MIVGAPAAAIGSKHCTVLPAPTQFHDQGPAPLTAEAVPEAQRFAVWALLAGIPIAAPQAPSSIVAPLTVITPLVPSSIQPSFEKRRN